MALVAFELFFRFLWGSLLLLTFVSRGETSERFPRIASYISLGTALFCAFLALMASLDRGSLYLSLALLSFGGLIYAHFIHRLARVLGFLLIVVSPFLFLSLGLGRPFFSFLGSALLLGSVYMGQYLGHWYLTVPGMHIREFKKVVSVIFLALAFKWIDLLTTLYQRWGHNDLSVRLVDEMGRPRAYLLGDPESLLALNAGREILGLAGSSYWGLGLFGLLVLATRVLWGLLAPTVMAFMVYKTVSMRSTQSATGILYAMSVMVLVGEACAIYMLIHLGYFL